MIPGDLAAELAGAVRDFVAAGALPASAAGVTATGTWRPAPALAAAAGGTRAASYTTSLPFELARLAGEQPAAVAARLAAAVEPAGWISAAEVTGAGYLTITVTDAALGSVAVRVSQAGPACVTSDALRGISRPAPPRPDLAAAPGWRAAWRGQAAALAGRLAVAAGATAVPPAALPAAGAVPAGRPARGPGGDDDGDPGGGASGDTVGDAVAYAGDDAVRYWLARLPASRAGVLDQVISVSRDPAASGERQPYAAQPYLLRDLAPVTFALSDAAATGRWATELGVARADRAGPPGAAPLGCPAEIVLLTELSWLAERVAGAARRRQPAELPRYLERLAAAWRDCREACPALPFGGAAAPRDADVASARLGLADATRTALAAGLGLIGVNPESSA